MSSKRIILLGGTGKVSRNIAPLLSSANYHTVVASRSGSASSLPNVQGLKFDWFDATTWAALFKDPVAAIFLVVAPALDQMSIVKPFIELAISHHVRRFVLLSASVMPVGDGPAMSQVSSYIKDLGSEYAILRPTWFMENFCEQHGGSIRDNDCIVTAAGEGKVPFVACEDIAAVAFRTLTDANPHNTDYLLVGPASFSYGEVTAILTKLLGRDITHVQISEQESAVRMEKDFGAPPAFAKMLAELDTYVSEGKEDIKSDAILNVTGREPQTLESFLRKHAGTGIWNKK